MVKRRETFGRDSSTALKENVQTTIRIRPFDITARSSYQSLFHHCFAPPFVNPADERHNGKCDNAKDDTWQQCRHTRKKPDSNSHHREYQKSEDINREHHFAIDPSCSSCLFQFFSHPPEVVPEIKPLLILLPFHHAQCINPR